MIGFRRFLVRLGTLFRIGRLERELDDELRFHIEMQIEENIRRGMSPAEARTTALRSLGGMEVTKEQVREESRARFVETLVQDLRYGARRMVKKPGFTTIAILMLAVGIGANTAIFSVFNKILLEDLPYESPDRLFRLHQRNDERGWTRMSFSQPNYLDFLALNRSFEKVGAFTTGEAVLTGIGDPLRVGAGRASPDLFDLLGIEPIIGRNFLPEEDVYGAENRVVLLGNELWRTRFSEAPGIVGGSITLDNMPCTVVGVLPAGENWLEWYDLYVPLAPNPDDNRGNNILWPIGRLRDGVSIDQAKAEWDAAAAQIMEQFPDSGWITGVTFDPIENWLIGSGIRRILWIMMTAVGLVLLIACANLANMLLAQATGRQKEIAISTALGAGRGRLIRQMLTESTLLAVVGGLLGVFLAVWIVGVFKALDPGGIPRLEQVSVNMLVCVFTLAVTVGVGVLSGLVPALQAPSSNVGEALKEGGRISTGRSQHRIRGTLIVAEMAVSVMLLIGAGLMIRSFIQLQNVERGFQTENRVLFDLTLPDTDYGENEVLAQFLRQFEARLEAIPAVSDVGAVSAAPLEGLNTNMGIYVFGQAPGPDESMPLADWREVTPGYFRAAGLPLLLGRTFDDLSAEEAAPLIDRENNRYELNVVISESCARMLWPDEDPIGKRAVLWSEENTIGIVIGVVGDMRERDLEDDPREAVYLSYTTGLWNPVTFIVHTAGDPASVIPSVRANLAEIDPNLPIFNIRLFDDLVNDSTAARRFNTMLLLIFAGIALLLACAGIYGVMAYSVTERIPEIAIRITLGARPSEVLGLLVNQGMKRALLGAAIGIAAALGLSQFLRSMLFGVTPIDVPTYVIVALLLLVTALLANYLPALRTTRIDPVSALREE